MKEDTKHFQDFDHLHLDIANAKKEREKLLQQHMEQEQKSEPSNILSDSTILNACTQINTMLQKNLITPIECIPYPRSCTMLNIVQLSHIISDILYNQSSESERIKEENSAIQTKLDKALEENRDYKYRLQAEKEKDKFNDTKLNKATLQSERKVNELESTVRTLKNKLNIKEKEIDNFKAQIDGKNNTKKSSSLLYKAQLEEKQTTIKKLERELDKALKQNKSLEEIVNNLQNSAFLDSKFREAQEEIVNI